ncbi:MAG: TrkA family potassium uptake protein [Chloroflexota bacterium]|nr:TrkA family potassium uptake protein [Chloroflexota bacterium]
MYIVVVGGGEVGYHLSKILLNDGHEVLILEQNPARCDWLAEELGGIIYRGDGCEAATLDCVGTGRADMLVAVTDGDEDNLISCQVAKHMFNVPRTIARIRNPNNEKIFRILGVDATVSSTDIILAHIEQELPLHPLVRLMKLKSGELEVVEIWIPPDSESIGKKLSSFHMPKGAAVLLVISKNKGIQIPSDDTVLEADDKLVTVMHTESEDSIRALLTGK